MRDVVRIETSGGVYFASPPSPGMFERILLEVVQMLTTGPLSGVRIIDLTSIYSGPICASILGDQGADVIKVEAPTDSKSNATRRDREHRSTA